MGIQDICRHEEEMTALWRSVTIKIMSTQLYIFRSADIIRSIINQSKLFAIQILCWGTMDIYFGQLKPTGANLCSVCKKNANNCRWNSSNLLIHNANSFFCWICICKKLQYVKRCALKLEHLIYINKYNTTRQKL